MANWIALLRGINVGGKNIMPMAQLRDVLISLKFTDVQTYIQSGNIVFDCRLKNPAAISKKVSAAILEEFEMVIPTLVISKTSLLEALNRNPFPEAEQNPKSLHFFFLAQSATNANTDRLNDLTAPTEKYQLDTHVMYLFAPDGTGRSKLAAGAEKQLGVPATARNLRTIQKILELATN